MLQVIFPKTIHPLALFMRFNDFIQCHNLTKNHMIGKIYPTLQTEASPQIKILNTFLETSTKILGPLDVLQQMCLPCGVSLSHLVYPVILLLTDYFGLAN